MSTDRVERVAEAAQRASTTGASDLSVELQPAVVSAADDGASLTDIAAATHIPTLVILDALDSTIRLPLP